MASFPVSRRKSFKYRYNRPNLVGYPALPNGPNPDFGFGYHPADSGRDVALELCD